MKAVEVLREFKEPIRHIYPAHQQGALIEDYAAQVFDDLNGSERFVPINWTGWFCNHDYGKATEALRDYTRSLQLGKYTADGERLFTVVQNDDGTRCDDILHANGVRIFAAGGVGDVAVPLHCSPHPCVSRDLKYVASFFGSPTTHPCRQRMIDAFAQRTDVLIGKAGTNSFRSAMYESAYALCPRGYGKTSFRLYEAIQLGCVPVYIYDDFWAPDAVRYCGVPWEDFAVLCHVDELDTLPQRLRIDETYITRKNVLETVRDKFTLAHTCDYILEELRDGQH